VIAVHQTIDYQLASYRFDGSANTRIVRGQKAHQRNHEQARVQLLRPVCLDKALATAAEAVRAHICMNPSSHISPLFDRRWQFMLFSSLDGSIHRHPGHDLRMSEMLPGAADFPDSLIRVCPDAGDVISELALDGLRSCGRSEAGEARMMQRIRHFSVNVELVLAGGGISYANRARRLVAG
jgi:hypothetical protein